MKNMNRPQGLIGDIKLSNIHVSLVTKQKKRENEAEKLFEETMPRI